MVTDLDREKIAAANYQDGFDEGVKQGKLDTAKKMLSLELDNSIIEQATGLSKEQIAELKRDYSKSCQ